MKFLSVLLALCLLLPLPAAAEETVPDVTTNASEATAAPKQFTYAINNEGGAELYDFIPSKTFKGECTIPSEVDGHPVVYIGNACFLDAKGLTSVTIPAGVTDMGNDVFLGCTSLKSVKVAKDNPYYTVEDDILYADSKKMLCLYPAAREGTAYTVPAPVEEIAPSAFAYAQNLREVTLPDNVRYIDSYAFAYSNLEKVSISGKAEILDDFAFSSCEKLSSVTLGNGLKNIYNATFYDCPALTQITLPDTLTFIGQYAFCSTGLESVTIPASLETISYCAFGYDGNPSEDSLTPKASFTIYGEKNTMAQEYATTRDEDNDYENHFTFVAVEDANEPYELGKGTLATEKTATAASEGTETEGETESGAKAPLGQKVGAGLFENTRLLWIIGIGGGAALILAVVLIVVFVKKPKKKKTPEDSHEDKS